MSNRLPATIKPLDLVQSQARMEGELAIRGMTRLKGRLQGTDGVVQASLYFGKDAKNIRFIKGRLTTTLELLCQRCLENMQFPVDIAVSLGIIGAAGDAERLPEDYEPLLLDESETVELSALIEDELLLALPIVALHARDECSAEFAEAAPEGATETDEDTHRPFAGLADLMKSR
ncbi:MAG: YceD family protein [Gammaproteobacteria bacterium]